MRIWTAEAKARQSELIKGWKPWQYSTGARTIEGKAVVARNATKGKEARLKRLEAAMIELADLNARIRKLSRDRPVKC